MYENSFADLVSINKDNTSYYIKHRQKRPLLDFEHIMSSFSRNRMTYCDSNETPGPDLESENVIQVVKSTKVVQTTISCANTKYIYVISPYFLDKTTGRVIPIDFHTLTTEYGKAFKAFPNLPKAEIDKIVYAAIGINDKTEYRTGYLIEAKDVLPALDNPYLRLFYQFTDKEAVDKWNQTLYRAMKFSALVALIVANEPFINKILILIFFV